MKRRNLIKYLTLGIGGTMVMPAWASGWQIRDVRGNPMNLSLTEEATLAEMAETIIPETDIPGAKKLEVHQFIQKIIADCSDKNTQETFQSGFGILDEAARKSYHKSFLECNSQQRTEILQIPEKDKENTLRNFYSLIKDLTIWGFMSSEYVMVNHLDYKHVPGKFSACVPVE